MPAISTIHLTQRNYTVPPVVHMVQGDSARYLMMVLDDVTFGYDYDDDYTATVSVKRPDGTYYTTGQLNIFTETNTVAIDGRTDMGQILTQPGTIQAQLKIEETTFGTASTFDFHIECHESTSGVSETQIGYSLAQITRILNEAGTLPSGQPTAVTTAAEMTQTDRIYLYMGTEEGYIQGHWYWYDSDAEEWVDSGEYGTAITNSRDYYQATGEADSTVTVDAGVITKIPLVSTGALHEGSSLTLSADGGIQILESGRYIVTGSTYSHTDANSTRRGCYIMAGASFPEATELVSAFESTAQVSDNGAIGAPLKMVELEENTIVYLAGRQTGGTSCYVDADNTATYLYVERVEADTVALDGITSELYDIRIGADGTTYASAGDAVRSQIIEALNSGGGISDDLKQALLQLARKVAYIDEDGQNYYDDLYDALYPAATGVTLSTASWGTTTIGDTRQLRAYVSPSDWSGTVVWASSDATVATVTQTGLVTIIGYGQAVITATADSVSGTCNISVTQLAVRSLAAVINQTGTIYDTDDFATELKQYLTVTATMADSSTQVIPSSAYTVSTTYVSGAATGQGQVTYADKTSNSFNFTVIHYIDGYYYRFEDNLSSSGSKDFAFDGTENYAQGVNGKAYWHNVSTEGTASTDQGTIYKTGLSEDALPWSSVSNDFTISEWHKSVTSFAGHIWAAIKYYSATSPSGSNRFFTTFNMASGTGWELNSHGTAAYAYAGVRLMWDTSSRCLLFTIHNSNYTKSSHITLRPPSGFEELAWHHYAFTKNGDNYYFFVDGTLIFTASSTYAIYNSRQVVFGGGFNTSGTDVDALVNMAMSDYIDDLFIAESCKWTSGFDANDIEY